MSAVRAVAHPGRLRALAVGLALLLSLPGSAAAGALEDAQKALAGRRFSEAAEAFTALLEKDASNREAALGLARAAVDGRLGKDTLENAQSYLEKLVKQPAGEGEARVALGSVYLALAPLQSEAKYTEFALRDAQTQFEKALALSAADAQAQVGLAKVKYNQGDFDAAAELLDKLLEGKAPASASYWRGMLYYEQARAAYAEDPRAERTTALFKKARAAFEVSARVDAGSYDTWMQLAYAAQYLGEVDAALEAYLKAAGLDALSRYPLKGLKALKTGDDAGYVAVLERVAKQCPGNVAVHLHLGEAHLSANRFEPAAKELSLYLERAPEGGAAYTLLGRAYQGQGKEQEALRVFEKALTKNPRDVLAADELDQRLREKHARAAQSSVKAAKECEDDYERLAKLTQDNPFVLNNGAFILREAYVAHQGDGSWVPVLKASARLYEAAAKVVDDQPYDVVEAAPWATRYAWAQITSDTGLMFQFYEPTFDAEKAETYYLRALKLTGTGYFDAWNNLHKLYLAKHEYQKAYDLAAQAAQGLRTEAQQEHATGRKMAEAEMARLVREGKAKGE